MGTGVEMKIDEKWIQAIVAAEVQGALVKSLGSEVYEKTILGIVRQALSQKVDANNGQPSKYSGDRDPTFVEYTLAQEIRKMTKESLAKMLEAKRAELEAIILQEIERSKTDLVQAFMASVINAAVTNDWRLGVNVEWKKESY
jgi:hypothetical protein